MHQPRPGQRHSLDLLRIVAAFGIVWFHMQAPGDLVGALALSMFLIVAGALSVGSAARRGGAAFWRARAARLLGLWLAWSGIYLVADALRFGWAEAARIDEPLTLLVGPSIHLWFLPFLAAASGLAAPAAAVLATPGRVRLGAALLAAPCALPSLALHRGLLPEPLAQWSVALVPLAYGLLFAAGRDRGAPEAALAFALVAAATGWWGWGSPFAPALAMAALLFEGLWRLPLRHPALPRLSALTLNIYLVHPFFILAWYAGGGGSPALGAVAVFLLSAAAAWALALAGRLLSAAGTGAARPGREPA
jgi:peptidoglycan/LPS O-acetylase OafA/YrhL